MLWWLSSIRIPKSNGSQAIKRWLRSVRIFSKRKGEEEQERPAGHPPLFQVICGKSSNARKGHQFIKENGAAIHGWYTSHQTRSGGW